MPLEIFRRRNTAFLPKKCQKKNTASAIFRIVFHARSLPSSLGCHRVVVVDVVVVESRCCLLSFRGRKMRTMQALQPYQLRGACVGSCCPTSPGTEKGFERGRAYNTAHRQRESFALIAAGLASVAVFWSPAKPPTDLSAARVHRWASVKRKLKCESAESALPTCMQSLAKLLVATQAVTGT